MNGDLRKPSPWHEGERTLQATIGAVEQMEEVGQRNVRNFLTQQHKDFYPLLPLIVLGTVDPAGDAWATLKAGNPGFVHALDDTHLAVEVRRDSMDPADAGMNDGASIGVLGIELPTRRRNRMNGAVKRASCDRFTITVEHAFGNCPKYIQQRRPLFARDPSAKANTSSTISNGLDERSRNFIRTADTFFVATYVDRESHRQIDVSHRGGKRGFIRIDNDVLTIPDFKGNNFFNTLGNILMNSRAGLVFADFTSGDILQLTGRGEVVLDREETMLFPGAERLWRFKTDKVILRTDALPLRSSFNDDGWSPSLETLGPWTSPARHILTVGATALSDGDSLADEDLRCHRECTKSISAIANNSSEEFQKLVVTRIVDEASDIRSLYLRSQDGSLQPFEPGQHLKIKLPLYGQESDAIRHYSLSNFETIPTEYRLGIKRGRPDDKTSGSNYIHSNVKVGTELLVSAPRGNFTLNSQIDRPVALISIGVGITPMMSMLHALAIRRYKLPVWFIHGARSGVDYAYGSEVRDLLSGSLGFRSHIRFSRPGTADILGQHHDSSGRIDLALIASLITRDAEVFICGPTTFMTDLGEQLKAWGVPTNQVHFESFGLKPDLTASVGREGATVRIAGSPRELSWSAQYQSILELAEDAGIELPFSCRAGDCGSCERKLVEGEIAYAIPPIFKVRPNHILACLAQPLTDVIVSEPDST